MRKILSLFVAAIFSATMFADDAANPQGGTLSSNAMPIEPSTTVTLTYDGTGTNFAAWTPNCFIHAWLEPKSGQTFSKSYSTDWVNCQGDGDYSAIAANRKMTAGANHTWTIDMNIKTFFSVATEDLAKIAGLGAIVCTQWNGGSEPNNNKTQNLLLPVSTQASANVTAYFVNTGDWSKVQAFVWPEYGNAYKDWPGELMTKTANQVNGKDVYSYTFPNYCPNIIFNNKTGTSGDQTSDLVFDAAKPYFNFADKEWYASLAEIEALVPAKFYVTGDSALVVDAGKDQSKRWAANAIKSEKDTLILNLKANQEYFMKVVDGANWKGFEALTDTAEGLIAVSDDNGGYNISFRLASAGEVKIIYKSTMFKLIGNFYIEPKMTVKFVPCAAWKADGAKTAAWVWQKGYDGQFTSFFTQAVAGSDTLQAIVEQRMDSIIFVRCNSALTEPKWNSVTETENVLAEMPKDSIDKTSLVFTSYRIDKGTWEVGPKYFITGDSAFLKDANVDKAAWNEEAIKVTADSYTITGLKANQEYSLKVVLDGTWAGGTKGFSNLTGTVPAGITTDATDNIIFKLATAGDVTITYNATQFTIAGNFYIEPKVNLRFVACPAWKASGAKTAAWVWQKGKEGYFTPFFTQVTAGSDTLQVEVEERVDSVIFVRCNSALTEPKWNSLTETENVLTEMPKDSIDKTSLVFTSYQLDKGTWEVWVPAKFYVTGDAVGLGEWNPMAIKAVKDTVVLNLPAGTYQMKITLDGDWATAKGYSDLTEKADGLWESAGGNISFALAAAGEVKVVYNASVFKLIGTFDETQVPVVLADGYYLIGQTGWTVSDLSASLKFAETATTGEYMLNVTLATFQQIKVVALQNNVITTWYPDGVDNAYVVDNDHAGVRDIYFRPAGNSPAWDEFGGYIWMGNNGGGTGIDSNADGVKAVKVLRDGQLLIIKGEKIFNVLGTQIQ